MRQDYKDVCKWLSDKYGIQNEVFMCLEEMAELQKELIKNINRGKNNIEEIVGEIADVYLMLEQMKISFNITDESVEKVINYKIDRLLKNVEKDRNGEGTVYTQ